MPFAKHEINWRRWCRLCNRLIDETEAAFFCSATADAMKPKGFFDDEPLSVWRERVASLGRGKEAKP